MRVLEAHYQCRACVALITLHVPICAQYMMGDDYMAAPIFNLGQRSRMVYFPRGVDWALYFSGELYKGGTTANVAAPLNHFPLFHKVGLTKTLATPE